MNAHEIIAATRRNKRKRAAAEARLGAIVYEVRIAVKNGRLTIKELAEIDRIQAIWLFRESGLAPNTKEAHKRVTALVGPAKPGEAERPYRAIHPEKRRKQARKA